jgi:hypothetical protein
MDLFFYSEIIVKVILSAMLGMVCALFSYFLDYCFWEGSIFEKYLPWLAKNVVKLHNKKEFEIISKLPKESQEKEFLNVAPDYFIFKPLGGCAVCMNIYIALISYALISYFTGLQWYFAIPYIFVSSAFLRKLVKATY